MSNIITPFQLGQKFNITDFNNKLQEINTNTIASNIDISATTANLFGLSGVDANVDKVLQKTLPQIEVIQTFLDSTTWTVPANVTECDIYLVGGGADGEDGRSDRDASGGGSGGKGGKIKYITGVNIIPNTQISVLVGTNEGESEFGEISTKFSTIQQPTYTGTWGTGESVTSLKTSYAYVSNNTPITVAFDVHLTLCPLNGKIYGLSGAPGGGTYQRESSKGHSGGSYDLSIFGKTFKYSGGTGISGADGFPCGSGGGASANGLGTNAITVDTRNIKGGNGANALPNTGNGGGGGGGVYQGSGGSGGLGGSGIIIIRYYKKGE